MQPSHTQSGVDLMRWLAPVASTLAWTCATRRGSPDLAERLKSLGTTLFARVLIETNEPPRVLPERDGVVLKQRFRRAIGFN